MSHPHPDKLFVTRQYRRYVLACKKQFGTARSQVHYRELIATYQACKREVLSQ